MFERFTDRARRVILLAQQAAIEAGHDTLDTTHLMIGLHREGTGVAAVVLREAGEAEPTLGPGPTVDDATALAELGIDLEEVRSRLREAFGENADQRMTPFTDDAKAALQRALHQSYELGHDYVGTEHLLLALDVEGRHRDRLLELAAPDYKRIREAERRLFRLHAERGSEPAVQAAISAAGQVRVEAAHARAAVTRALADGLEAALASLD